MITEKMPLINVADTDIEQKNVELKLPTNCLQLFRSVKNANHFEETLKQLVDSKLPTMS